MIDFERVDYFFKDSVKFMPRGDDSGFCPSCKKVMKLNNFFRSNNIERHPNKFLPFCRTCCQMGIVDTKPETFLPLLKEIDVPYHVLEWRRLYEKKTPGTSTIFGKYVSLMRIYQNAKYRWADSKMLCSKATLDVLEAFRCQDINETQAQEKTERVMGLEDFSEKAEEEAKIAQSKILENNLYAGYEYGFTEKNSKYGYTQEQIDNFQWKWGKDFQEDDYKFLEEDFKQLEEGYLLNDPVARKNAEFICLLNLKLRKAIAIDDTESSAKLARELDLFTRSSALQPIQQKDRNQAQFAIC